MRNENLELAQSSGSESSPSWAANTPRASDFNFDFSQSRTIDDLTTQFKTTLKASRSSELLSEPNSEEKSTPSSSSQYLYAKAHTKCHRLSSGDFTLIADEKKGSKNESKIAKFLRRTQSANEDHHHHHRSGSAAAASSSSTSGASASTGPKCSGESSSSKEKEKEHLDKIDDTEDSKRRKRNKLGTDMKFRLGFLKRRHTEGTIHSGSVRPQPEEAQKWANSFSDLMASKYGQALFRAFLQREFSDENIEFWLAIEEFRKSRQNKLNAKAVKIYNDFIIAQAPKEVNLDALTREGLISKMSSPNVTTFDQAQKRIQGLLEADAYIRFLKSDLYLELLHPEKYQT